MRGDDIERILEQHVSNVRSCAQQMDRAREAAGRSSRSTAPPVATFIADRPMTEVEWIRECATVIDVTPEK
jgi:hypothetical protein